MSRKPSTAQVVAALEFFARLHPAGLGLLLGQVEDPSLEEIAEIFGALSQGSGLNARISGGRFIPDEERVILMCEILTGTVDAIGGWEHIHKMTREVKQDVHPEYWREMADYAAYVSPGGKVRDGLGGMGGRVFSSSGGARHDTCIRTTRRRFRRFLRGIAVKILSFPPDGEFELTSSTRGGYPN
jgi:hypothetical protein